MKIILATTTLIALVALGIIGTNSNSSSLGNAFAQMDLKIHHLWKRIRV